MIAQYEKPRWPFYLGWVVLNLIAVVAAGLISLALVTLITQMVGDTLQVDGQSRITEDFLFMYVLFPVIGLLVGFLQYLLLRRYLPRMLGWIPATFLGWLMPFVTGFFILSVLGMQNDTVSLMLGLWLIGAMVALPQWLVLRQRVRHAFWWILAGGLGWGLVGLLNLVTSDPLPVLMAIGLLPAMATGMAFWLLLDWYPKQQVQSSVPGVT
jgi:hypothetical protein